MKISESKCNRNPPPPPKKKKKNLFNFDSIKNSFCVHKVSGITILFPNFDKKLSSGFLKESSLYFTSPMKISKSKCNSKTPKNPFNFESIQNSFWVHKVTGIRIYSQNFTEYYWVVFEKSSLYFTSHMKISKSKSNNKNPQNPF